MKKLLKIALLVSVLLPFMVHSETSSDEMLREIQERANKVKQFKELLGNPDQTVRVSALDVMLKSDDQVMKEIAFNLGFASADDTMRAIALKNKILYMKYLNFDLTLTDKPNKGEKKSILNFYRVNVQEYNVNSGAFNFGKYGHSRGQVSGTGLNLQSNSGCNANTILSEGAMLKGSLKCPQGNYLMELQLQ